MALPVAFKDELVARSDIVDVVSDYVTLTPKGGSFWGLCPFHGEKTPSFHVLPDRQLYHCFGCGKGGGVISFVMDVENLPYIDAVRLLAKRAGMEVPEDGMDQGRQRQRSRLLALNKEAARFFHSQLHSPVGQGGLQYLQNRGLSRGTMTRFGLGFAPDSWDSLIRAMAQKGFEKRDLLDAGLAVSNKKGGIYDRFRGRVMFPIIDLRGDVIGFGGRVLGDGTPKYLNSPDTPVFNKSRNLFALNLAKNTKQGRLLLTEGYMDTISLHQAGFDCAVASLGTSLTADHAKLLSRFTKEVILCYDGDTAGVQAANRAIPMLEKTGLKVRVLRITGAKDPDEFIKTFGREAFARLLDRSENYVAYNPQTAPGILFPGRPPPAQRVCPGRGRTAGGAGQPRGAGGLRRPTGPADRRGKGRHPPGDQALPQPAPVEGQKEAGQTDPDPGQPGAAQGSAYAVRQPPLRPGGGGHPPAADAGRLPGQGGR